MLSGWRVVREGDIERRGTSRGVLIGLVVGALLTLLFTPYSGKRFRSRLLSGVDRARAEVRGTERYGGGEAADPLAALKRRFEEAKAAGRIAYDDRKIELRSELERDRRQAITARSGR